MATMTISLPEQMKEWVESLTKKGEYSSSSDYVRDLIRRDRGNRNEPMTMEELEQMLTSSFASGVSERSLSEIFEDAMLSVDSMRKSA